MPSTFQIDLIKQAIRCKLRDLSASIEVCQSASLKDRLITNEIEYLTLLQEIDNNQLFAAENQGTDSSSMIAADLLPDMLKKQAF